MNAVWNVLYVRRPSFIRARLGARNPDAPGPLHHRARRADGPRQSVQLMAAGSSAAGRTTATPLGFRRHHRAFLPGSTSALSCFFWLQTAMWSSASGCGRGRWCNRPLASRTSRRSANIAVRRPEAELSITCTPEADRDPSAPRPRFTARGSQLSPVTKLPGRNRKAATTADLGSEKSLSPGEEQRLLDCQDARQTTVGLTAREHVLPS